MKFIPCPTGSQGGFSLPDRSFVMRTSMRGTADEAEPVGRLCATRASVHVPHGRKPTGNSHRPAETCYRDLLGVKWSQVQIRQPDRGKQRLSCGSECASASHKSNHATLGKCWGPRARCEHLGAHVSAGQVVGGSMLAARSSVCTALLAATRKDIIAGAGCQCEALAR